MAKFVVCLLTSKPINPLKLKQAGGFELSPLRHRFSVTRLSYFGKILILFFSAKVAQITNNFLGCFENSLNLI